MKPKILFLHGFYASGQCVPAVALRNTFEGKAEVLTPDLPIHPKEAVGYIRAHQYKSPRKNGKQDFIIDSQLIAEFAEMEAHQFDNYHPDYKERIWGIFGEQDTLAHFEPLFLQYYSHSFHFPGGHTPTAEEVQQYYVPLIKKMLTTNLCNQ